MNPICNHCGHVNVVAQPMESISGDLLCCSKCGKWFAVGGAKQPLPEATAKLGDQFDALDLDALDRVDIISGPDKPPSTSSKPATRTAPQSEKKNTPSSNERSRAAPNNGPYEKRSANPVQGSNIPQPPAFVVPPSASTPPEYSAVPPDLTTSSSTKSFVPAAGRDNNTSGESAPSPLYRQMDVDQLDFSDPLEAIAEDALHPLEGAEVVHLEILDDPDLFRDMEVDSPSTNIDTQSNEQQRDDDSSRSERPRFSMIPARCRVCDTLQYVENKPGSDIACEICFAAIQLTDEKGDGNTKRRRWTAPSHMDQPKNTSPESIGKLVETTRGVDDEVSELIRDVDLRAGNPAPESQQNQDASRNMNTDDDKKSHEQLENDDELSLAPLDDDPATDRLGTIILEAETKALLESLNSPAPNTRSSTSSRTDPETPANSPPSSTTERTSPDDSNVEELEPGDLIEDDAVDESLTENDSVTEDSVTDDHASTKSKWRVSEQVESVLTAAEPIEELESLEAYESPGNEEVDLTLESDSRTESSKVPPPFVVPPIAAPNVDSRTAAASPTSSTTSKMPDGKMPDGKTPAGSRFKGNEKFESKDSQVKDTPFGPFSGQYEAWVRDMIASLRSIPIVLAGVGIFFVAYWLTFSWLMALSAETLLLRLLGFACGILGIIVGVPLWMAFLGVVANRSLSIGQDGRLSLAAIGSQGLQFGIVLAGALPGAALGAFSTSTAVTLFMATLTMLPFGLYFVTSAIVTEQRFCYYSPKVIRSMKEQAGEWSFAAIVSGMILMLALPVAVMLYYLPGVGASIAPLFAVPASLAYAVCIGRLAAQAMEMDSDESRK